MAVEVKRMVVTAVGSGSSVTNVSWALPVGQDRFWHASLSKARSSYQREILTISAYRARAEARPRTGSWPVDAPGSGQRPT